MSRYVSIAVILLVACVVGLLSFDPRARAQAGGWVEEGPPVCGDVNGDGVLDITDPVHLLNHLFLGGPPPECAPCEPRPCQPVRTGQTECFDARGSVIDCDSEDYPGQDGFHQAGAPLPLEERFVDNGDGTVSDRSTGLMWTKAPAEQAMNWQQALQYCEDLVLGTDDSDEEFEDWRLPNMKELIGLVRYDARWPQAGFDPVFEIPAFDGNANHGFWSATSYQHATRDGSTPERWAWIVNWFGSDRGARQETLKSHGGQRVLAVRGGLVHGGP